MPYAPRCRASVVTSPVIFFDNNDIDALRDHELPFAGDGMASRHLSASGAVLIRPAVGFYGDLPVRSTSIQVDCICEIPGRRDADTWQNSL